MQPLDRSSWSADYYEYADSKYADPTFPHADLDVQPDPMVYGKLPTTTEPKLSPYGDDWDMIHIGHCGLVSPRYPNEHPPEEDLRRWTPKGHVMIKDGTTS